MKLFRLVVDAMFFVGGAGAGIYWGVHHPGEAADIAQQEHIQAVRVQVAASKAKIEMLQKFGGDSPSAQQMLSDEQKKLDEANKELASEPGQ
jgi:hypothetical protein